MYSVIASIGDGERCKGIIFNQISFTDEESGKIYRYKLRFMLH